MAKTLVVIMNKDNAEGLMKCLESLTMQLCGICRSFDVLIIDGGSSDNSYEVASKFKEKYPCIEFIVQKIKGGVGPARIEAIHYALKKGYDLIIWGDSENIYDPNYIGRILKHIYEEGCDIVSGKAVVDTEKSVWSKIFFWYHSLHLFLKSLSKIHAPGNNKAVRTHIYNYVNYPPSSRSDDYYFTYLLLKKGLIKKVKVCHDDDAKLLASIPSTFSDILKWQKARVKGLIEGALIIGRPPPIDTYAWILFSLAPFIAITLLLTGHLTLFTIALILITMSIIVLLIIFYKLVAHHNVIVGHSNHYLVPLLGIIGAYLHGILTLYYIIYFTLKIKLLKIDILKKMSKTLELFKLSPTLITLKKDIFGMRR